MTVRVLIALTLLGPAVANAQTPRPEPLSSADVEPFAPPQAGLSISYRVRMATEAEAEAALAKRRDAIRAAVAASGLPPSAMRVNPHRSEFIGPFPSESLLDTGEKATHGFVDLAESAYIDAMEAERRGAVRAALARYDIFLETVPAPERDPLERRQFAAGKREMLRLSGTVAR